MLSPVQPSPPISAAPDNPPAASFPELFGNSSWAGEVLQATSAIIGFLCIVDAIVGAFGAAAEKMLPVAGILVVAAWSPSSELFPSILWSGQHLFRFTLARACR